MGGEEIVQRETIFYDPVKKSFLVFRVILLLSVVLKNKLITYEVWTFPTPGKTKMCTLQIMF